MKAPTRFSLAVLLAMSLLAAGFASDDGASQPTLAQKAAMGVASVTETDDAAPFRFEWIIDENGIVPLGDTRVEDEIIEPPHFSSGMSSTLANLLATASEGRVPTCGLTADGVFSSQRALGSIETTHQAGVAWSLTCTDNRFEVGLSASAAAQDAGLLLAGSTQYANDFGTSSGRGATSVSVLAELTVPIIVGENIHGDGSDRALDSMVTVTIDGWGDRAACIFSSGRQGTGIVVESGVAC